MLGFWFRTTVVFVLLLPQTALPEDLGKPPNEAKRLSALGDSLFRQSRFEEAESAYSDAVESDPQNVSGHLGMGKVAALLSDRGGAASHYSAAYQIEPSNPDAILAFASVVEGRQARQILLRNFLALSHPGDKRAEDVRARLRIEEQLGTRKVAELIGPYQPYRIPLSPLPAGGFFLHARLNGRSDLKLILDTGATGVALNPSAGRDAGLEILAPAALAGFGSAAPTPAHAALATLFETDALKITNLMVEISGTDLTPDADGIIGLDVFQDFLIRVDPRARELALTPFNQAQLDPKGLGARCTDCIRAYRLGHLLLVHGTVNGRGQGLFLLDTGSPYTLISHKLMPRSGATAMMFGAQGVQEVAMRVAPVTLRLGTRDLWGFDYATIDTDEISASNGTAIAGAIGFSVLHDLSLTVDYRSGLIKLGTPGRE